MLNAVKTRNGPESPILNELFEPWRTSNCGALFSALAGPAALKLENTSYAHILCQCFCKYWYIFLNIFVLIAGEIAQPVS